MAERDGWPFWSFFENLASWWPARRLPNCLFVHFAALKADLPGEIRRIARFLEIDVDERRWTTIVDHCAFDWMKANAAKSAPLGGVFWDGGAQTFVNKGSNGRWRDTLTEEDSRRYEAIARERLGEACARWLATGDRKALSW